MADGDDISPAAARVRSIYQRFIGDGRLSFVVAEWSEPDKPFVIYWRPFTLDDHARCFGGFGHDAVIDARNNAKVVVLKAEDRTGKKLFDGLADEVMLARQSDHNVVRAIANAIMRAPTVSEAMREIAEDNIRMTMHRLADHLGKSVDEIGQWSVATFNETLAFHRLKRKEDKENAGRAS